MGVHSSIRFILERGHIMQNVYRFSSVSDASYSGRLLIKNWNWLQNVLESSTDNSPQIYIYNLCNYQVRVDSNRKPVTSGGTLKHIWGIRIVHTRGVSIPFTTFFYGTDGVEYIDITASYTNLLTYLSSVSTISNPSSDLKLNVFIKISSSSDLLGVMSNYIDTVYNKDLIYPNENFIFLFKLISPKNAVYKKLYSNTDWTTGTCIYGGFNNFVSYIDFDLDIETPDLNITFNYAYVPSLQRSYFISVKKMIGSENGTNIFTLHFHEDILSSFGQQFVRGTSAFIERNENEYDDDLVDELTQMDYDKSMTVEIVTPTNNIMPTNLSESVRLSYIITTVNSTSGD